MKILVPVKWSALVMEIDPLTGAATTLEGRYGLDPASEAALEVALRLAEPAAAVVTAVTVGPQPADSALRTARAAGAAEAVRVDAPAGAASAPVAAAIADLAADADLVLAGAWSEDGGTATVAPTIAALLGRPQACGLLDLRWDGEVLTGERRLPAGRRERLRIGLPAVVSVEPAAASLRRASLPAVLAAEAAPIRVVHPPRPIEARRPAGLEPYRPRPRTLPPPPAGEDHRARIAVLSGTLETGPRAQQLRLEPPEAAAAIVDALRRWGYLEEPSAEP
jgi:electron transfer flavoprotein beta subunit